MAKYIVAVSGGVDSVVLLDALCRGRDVAGRQLPRNAEIIVAHFDHGIREDSVDDALFVEKLAGIYGVPFITKSERLGAGASEERARMRRYAFLFDACHQYGALLVTAHHADDAVETVAINLSRGTGWRGLAVLDNDKILRPFVGLTKHEIKEYAQIHTLKWNEDSTNSSDVYLRNRLRRLLDECDESTKWQVLALRARQVELKRDIDREVAMLVSESPYSRYFFGHIGDSVAIELLRHVFVKETGMSPATKPRQRALHAIKVAKPGSVIHVADGVSLRFTQRDFVIESTGL